MVGRWNAETFDYDTTWYPDGTKGINDAGIWSIDQDKDKCLWVGGDLIACSRRAAVTRSPVRAPEGRPAHRPADGSGGKDD